MTVPFQDLTRLHASIAEELRDAVQRVADSSAFVGGAEVLAFEEEYAVAHGRAQAVGCGSGTDALALALRALGIGPGDEVIVPAMTFVATGEAVVHVGATPVIVDVDPGTLLISSEEVRAARTSATRAVIPVHLYGNLVPLEVLRAWRDDGLIVVEDAAQAHLATWGPEMVGAGGHAACFSFYPGKNLGAWGDGGMVITDDLVLAAKVRSLRDHGRESKYRHDEIGWCSRLDGLQASVLRTKLRHLDEWTERRRDLAARYRELLGDLLVPWSRGAVHHLLVARLSSPECRSSVGDALTHAGIGWGVHYPIPLSKQPAFARWERPCPLAEAAADQILSLPMDPLMTYGDLDEVCAALELGLEP